MRKFWKKYKLWIIITVAFVLYVSFFASNKIIEATAIKQRINEMRREQDVYRQQAKEDSTFLENLKDDEFLEKYARETFLMKRAGEEIYIIEE